MIYWFIIKLWPLEPS